MYLIYTDIAAPVFSTSFESKDRFFKLPANTRPLKPEDNMVHVLTVLGQDAYFIGMTRENNLVFQIPGLETPIVCAPNGITIKASPEFSVVKRVKLFLTTSKVDVINELADKAAYGTGSPWYAFDSEEQAMESIRTNQPYAMVEVRLD